MLSSTSETLDLIWIFKGEMNSFGSLMATGDARDSNWQGAGREMDKLLEGRVVRRHLDASLRAQGCYNNCGMSANGSLHEEPLAL